MLLSLLFSLLSALFLLPNLHVAKRRISEVFAVVIVYVADAVVHCLRCVVLFVCFYLEGVVKSGLRVEVAMS